MANEHEAKLTARDGLRIPDLSDVAPGLTASQPHRLRMLATYYDTADLALARAGVTLRHRRGEPGDPWTVKLAGAVAGSALVRNELVFPGAPGRIPAQVADVVRALVRGRSLAPVARLRTVRTVRELRDDAGNVVVEIADDRVTAYEGRRRVARFRELEVELKSEGASRRRVLDAVVERLVDVGAERSRPMSKLVRALGPAARAPADVVVGEVRKRSDSADFVRHVIAGSVARMLEHDPALRVGAAGSDIHAFRVATRRLRSDLRTFGPLLDRAWVARLRDELKWIADVVGAVRDADVLEERLRDHSSPLTDVDAVGAQELLVALRTQRATARDAMLSALRSARYDELIGFAVSASARPVFATAGSAGRLVQAPARDVVAALVRRSWKRLRREVRRAGKHPSDEELHRIRILAKRTRYAAEAASKVVGKPAVTFAAAIAEVQTVLGDHHDASVAETWLRESVRGAPATDSGVVAGLLIAREQRERRRLHRSWRATWKKASAPRLRRWF